MIKKLQRKGKLSESEEGNLLLVNENEKAFPADETVISIWQRCDGDTTKEDLVEEINAGTDQSKNEIQEALDKITDELESLNLLETKE